MHLHLGLMGSFTNVLCVCEKRSQLTCPESSVYERCRGYEMANYSDARYDNFTFLSNSFFSVMLFYFHILNLHWLQKVLASKNE